MTEANVSHAHTCTVDCLQCLTMYRSTVSVNLQDRNLEWFPRLRAMSLAADEGEADQIELRTLQAQLEKTQALVANLSHQLTELRDQVWDRDLWQPIVQAEVLPFSSPPAPFDLNGEKSS